MFTRFPGVSHVVNVFFGGELGFDGFFDAVDYVADVVVFYIGAGGDAHAYLEKVGFDFVGVGGAALVDGLFVHGFPHGACLDFLVEHEHAHCLDVVVGLAIGCSAIGCMNYSSGSTNGGLDDLDKLDKAIENIGKDLEFAEKYEHGHERKTH